MVVVTPQNELTVIALGTGGGVGLGGLIVPSATVAMIAAPDALITTCAALSLSVRAVRAVGGSIGYSIHWNIFMKKITARLPIHVAEYALTAGLPLGDVMAFVNTFSEAAAEILKVPGATPAITAAATEGSQWAYAESLSYAW